MNSGLKIHEAGKNIAQLIPEVSFKLWGEQDFRNLINFEKISQNERDRIFNELEVTVLGLFILYMDNLKDQLDSNDHQQKKMLISLKQSLIEGFLSVYKDLKIEKQLIQMWEELIKIRLKEYNKDFKILVKEAETMEEFKKDTSFKLIWARVETITLDGLSHIRRGKLDQNDPLRKYLQKWIISLDTIFSKSIRKYIFQPIGEA